MHAEPSRTAEGEAKQNGGRKIFTQRAGKYFQKLQRMWQTLRICQNVEHVFSTFAGANNINICSNICRGARRPRRPPRLERRSAASADCSKPSKIAQNHSKPLKTAQNRSESLRIAQIRFKLTQNYENQVNMESFWATYSRFCLRSRDQHSNICSNICRGGCQLSNKNICSEPFPHFATSLHTTLNSPMWMIRT